MSAHQTVSKLSVPLSTTITSADQEYEKQTDPSAPPPSAPVYAARLNGLLKTLANAESAVTDCVKAREELVSRLEKLLESNRAALEQEKSAASRFSERKGEIEEKKQQVEMGIMQALESSENNGTPAEGGSASPPAEPDRPEMEALTPPSMEMGETELPDPDEVQESTNSDHGREDNVAPSNHSVPVSSNGSNKRRRVDDGGDFPDLGGDEIDADVAAMLKDGGS